MGIPDESVDNKPTNTYMLDALEDLDLITPREPFIMPEYESDFFEVDQQNFLPCATNNSVFPKKNSLIS